MASEVTTTKTYSYTDHITSREKVQYRLKMVDLDESIEYSAIKLIKPEGTNATPSLYPNPVSGTLTISGITADTDISLYDLNGQRVLVSLPVPNKTVQINTASLPSGIYMVKINQHGAITYHRIVKQP